MVRDRTNFTIESNRKSCICHGMAPLWMLYIVTLTYIYKGKTFLKICKYPISGKTVRTSEKCSSTTFIAVDTSHRISHLRMLYIVTFAYFFQITKFMEIYKCAKSGKGWELAKKSKKNTFIEINTSHRLSQCGYCTSWGWPTFSGSQNFWKY